MTGVIITCMICACSPGSKSHVRKNVSVKIDPSEKLLASKLFSAFNALNEQPVRSALIHNKPEVQKITDAINLRYREAVNNCRDADCLVAAFLLTSDEQKKLAKVFDTEAGDLNSDVLAANYIIGVYLGGKTLRYPNIDGGDFRKNNPSYIKDVMSGVQKDLGQEAAKNVFFTLPMLTALHILTLNNRDEAIRYEPITSGINKEAFEKVATTDFSKFKYSAILTPGLGPSVAGIALDPGGARRCELAAEQYRKGLAPFIIVSGGHVHPNKTEYSEGIEMKKYLVAKLKIPASAVIAEPYARHTTTNIRNSARIIYHFGMPAGKPVLIVSDVFQSSYVLMMKNRFMEELGYLPYKQIRQSEERKPFFLPDSAALKTNPLDPLDP